MTPKKQIIVTGASSGIGRAIATQLLEQGYRVIGVARNSKTQPVDHPEYSNVQMDLADLETLPAKLKQLASDYVDIDGIVFCAGRGQFGSLEEFSFAQIKSLMELNFVSQAYLAKVFLPIFKQRGSGDLIFIGSESALKGGRKGAIYSKNNVRVILINPGMVSSAFFDNLDFQPGNDPENYLLPEDVAEAVCYVLQSRDVINIDEINLAPLKHVVQQKKNNK